MSSSWVYSDGVVGNRKHTCDASFRFMMAPAAREHKHGCSEEFASALKRTASVARPLCRAMRRQVDRLCRMGSHVVQVGQETTGAHASRTTPHLRPGHQRLMQRRRSHEPITFLSSPFKMRNVDVAGVRLESHHVQLSGCARQGGGSAAGCPTEPSLGAQLGSPGDGCAMSPVLRGHGWMPS